MQKRYNIGDRLVKKNTRDSAAMEITLISYYPYETVYTLTPIKPIGDSIEIGEEALYALYSKINY